MKKILVLLIAGLISGCSTLPPQYSASPSRCLVRGVSSGNSDVKIRCVDGGDVIYVRGYHLGHEVWLETGVHKISVMCYANFSWGTHMYGTNVQIDVQPGFTYLLTTGPINSASDKPPVQITKEERK